MKLSDELIGQCRTALLAGDAIKADMFHRYATEVKQQEALIARLQNEVVTAGADALEAAADTMSSPSGAPYEIWSSGAGTWLRALAAGIRKGA